MQAKVIVFVLVLSSLLFLPVAANNQGLEWGVSVGSSADYTLVKESDGITDLEEDFYVVVSELEDIPDDLEYLEFFSLEVLFFWANGTEFDPSVHGMLITHFLPSWLLPVGNWTRITEVFTEFRSEGLNDTPEFWGYFWESTRDLGVFNRGNVEYSKSDGMLNHLLHEVMIHIFYEQTRAFYQEITRRPTPNLNVMLQAGIIIGSIVVVVVLVWRELLVRRKSR